jgi:hypothetical protein
VYQETVEPKLGKSVLYAGAAVGIAQHPNNEGKAMDAAREAAVKEANERYKKYRGKKCGNNIVPESIVGREVTVNDAKIVLSTQVLQAKHKP